MFDPCGRDPKHSIVCIRCDPSFCWCFLVRSGCALLGAYVAALLASVPRQSAPTRATKVWSHVKRAYPRSQRYCANDLFAGARSRKHSSPTIFKPRLSRCATSESVNTGEGRRLRLGTLGCLCCCLARVGATSKRANPRHQGVEPRQARLPRSQRYCANDLFAGARSNGARKHPSPTIFKPNLSRCATSESDNTNGGRRGRPSHADGKLGGFFFFQSLSNPTTVTAVLSRVFAAIACSTRALAHVLALSYVQRTCLVRVSVSHTICPAWSSTNDIPKVVGRQHDTRVLWKQRTYRHVKRAENERLTVGQTGPMLELQISETATDTNGQVVDDRAPDTLKPQGSTRSDDALPLRLHLAPSLTVRGQGEHGCATSRRRAGGATCRPKLFE